MSRTKENVEYVKPMLRSDRCLINTDDRKHGVLYNFSMIASSTLDISIAVASGRSSPRISSNESWIHKPSARVVSGRVYWIAQTSKSKVIRFLEIHVDRISISEESSASNFRHKVRQSIHISKKIFSDV